MAKRLHKRRLQVLVLVAACLAVAAGALAGPRADPFDDDPIVPIRHPHHKAKAKAEKAAPADVNGAQAGKAPAAVALPPGATADDLPGHTTGDAYTDFVGVQDLALPEPSTREIDAASMPWVQIPFARFGFNDALRTYNTQSVFGHWFFARRDQVVVDARISITLAPTNKIPDEIRQLEVSVNDEVLARWDAESLKSGERRRIVPIDSHLLAGQNRLQIRIYTYDMGPCQNVLTPGTWRVIPDGALELRSTPLPLPNELDILPLPFFDPDADKDTDLAVPFAFMEPPTETSARAAGLVASYFGMKAGSHVRFPVTYGTLPDASGVVFVTGQGPESLHLPVPDGPTIRLIDNPAILGGNAKLLVLQGRDHGELETAARRLALGTDPLRGSELKVDPRPTSLSAQDYKAPKWLKTQRSTKFSEIPGGDKLIHIGHMGDMVKLEFRVPPDMFAWPRDHIKATIEYIQLLPAGHPAPKIDVELNGDFLVTLPQVEATGRPDPHTYDIRLPRDRLRGTNMLVFHIAAIAEPDLCAGDSHRLQTIITGNSTFHLENTSNATSFPDIASFVTDGWPFTKEHDLNDTMLLLPAAPKPDELGAALSYLAHFAAVTGYPTTKVTIRLKGNLEGKAAQSQKNILVVGAESDLPVLETWSKALPMRFDDGKAAVPTMGVMDWAAALLSGRLPNEGTDGAAYELSRANAAMVLQAQSPYQHGKSIVVVTGPTPASLPSLVDLDGQVNATTAHGDVLVYAGGHRSQFLFGRSWFDEPLNRLTTLMWDAAKYWPALILVLALASTLLALVLRAWLSARAQNRLSPEVRR